MAATNNIYPSSATNNVNFNLVEKKKKNGANYNHHHAHLGGGGGSSINAAAAAAEGCGLKQLYCSSTRCSRINRATTLMKFDRSATTPNLGVNILPAYTIFSTGSAGSGSIISIGQRRHRWGAAIKVVASATTSDDGSSSSSSFLRFLKFSTSGKEGGTGGVAKTTQLLISDIVWPAAGAFVAMAAMGRLDQFLAPKGLLLTVPPFGAVCTVLLVTPTAPAAKKYNMFVSQIGCAAIGVLAYSLFGPGWMARSLALAASIAFMISTGSTHPPAASLPLMFIDGVKFHNLQWWYALYPGAAGCLLLCLIQEIVSFMKTNYKF